MEIRRFYVNSDDITDNVVTICGDEFWHLTKVLRYKVGYQIIVCNDSDGKDYLCTIDLIEKDYAQATVCKIINNECKTKVGITLFQALPKGDKADLIVQKAVELGVQNIVFFNSDYVSEKKFNIDRLHKINVEACKQCGRSRLSKIYGLLTFDEMLQKLNNFDKVLVCYENEKLNGIKNELKSFNGDNLAIIIGSEGGFSEQEIDKCKLNSAVSVTLGNRIMRCETASIVVCGIVMYELGEMSR